MPLEIERKFLIKNPSWRAQANSGQEYIQAYLLRENTRAVRLRIVGENAFLTIKGAPQGIQRLEFEYAIPRADAESMIAEMTELTPIHKIRYLLPYRGFTWEIDEFLGENKGLFIAEVELKRADQVISLPDWLGEEVSHDPRYLNSNLIAQPYSTWDSP